jgi:predicted Kef-type K+ transport protein
MELSLLKGLLLVFALAIAVLLICHQLRVAATVGFLVTGVLVGPQGLGLIGSVKEVEILAENEGEILVEVTNPQGHKETVRIHVELQ